MRLETLPQHERVKAINACSLLGAIVQPPNQPTGPHGRPGGDSPKTKWRTRPRVSVTWKGPLHGKMPIEFLVYRPVPAPRTLRAHADDTRSAPPNMEDYREAYRDTDMRPTTHVRLHAGCSAPETSDAEESNTITELLAATGTAIIKPHLFVVLGSTTTRSETATTSSSSWRRTTTEGRLQQPNHQH